MITPYSNKIRRLKEDVIERIEDVDYATAAECFDRLSLLYMNEVAFYSRTIEDEISLELKERTRSVELTRVMSEWREMIELQEKWGEIH